MLNIVQKWNFHMSQGIAATANRWGGQISIYLLTNFLRMLCAKNHENLSIFDEVIAKTKRVTFFAPQCTYTQRTSKHPELDRSGSGLRFNSKCVGIAKMEVARMFAGNVFGHRSDGELINFRRLCRPKTGYSTANSTVLWILLAYSTISNTYCIATCKYHSTTLQYPWA
jgi:hypothetical protein